MAVPRRTELLPIPITDSLLAPWCSLRHGFSRNVAYIQGLRKTLDKRGQCMLRCRSPSEIARRAMVLRRSLPQLADHRVATDRHTGASQVGKTAAYRQPLQSQPNPLQLISFSPVRYPGIGLPLTHQAYPIFFQRLRCQQRTFLARKLMAPLVRQSNLGIPWARPGLWKATDAGTRRKTYLRTKLESGVNSATCQERSEERSPVQGRAAEGQPRLHVTVPRCNAGNQRRNADRAPANRPRPGRWQPVGSSDTMSTKAATKNWNRQLTTSSRERSNRNC
jgi:hypothetical protein